MQLHPLRHLVEVSNGILSMNRAADQMMFVGAKRRMTGRAPWLAV
jgi:hypothetical protein